nr:expressed protein [Hymenolepis microstoma]
MKTACIHQKGVNLLDERERDFERVVNAVESLPGRVCRIVGRSGDSMMLQFFEDITITITAPQNYPHEPARVDEFKRVCELIGLDEIEAMIFEADATMFRASFAYIFTIIVTKLCVIKNLPMPRSVRKLQQSIEEEELCDNRTDEQSDSDPYFSP